MELCLSHEWVAKTGGGIKNQSFFFFFYLLGYSQIFLVVSKIRSCWFQKNISLSLSLQLCVQNSPQEARNMLLQNPQLAYALLQAQVVMRIVDPEIALVRMKR